MPPAAANDGGKNSHKNQSHSSVTKNSVDPKTTKLCHIVKRADFDGYGFNLHTEKSKPGQYIGKVDANSPAEIAGLREGYRILEVNGIPINNETHKQVVQRIKAIAWEVKLLVSTDIKVDATNNNNNNSSSSSNNKKVEEKQIQKNGNNNDKNHMKISTDNGNGTRTSTTMNSNGNEHSKNAKPALNIEMTKINNMASGKAPTATTTTTTPTTPPPPLTPPPPPSVATKLNEQQHGATAAVGGAGGASAASSTSASLKLPSTAAEMRAILQSKKKFNPKSEEVNLQEKYEIVQKL